MDDTKGQVYVKPSVVLFLGQLDLSLTTILEAGVERRIRATLELPVPVTAWGHISDFDPNSQPTGNSQDQIRLLLSSYLSISYWDKLESLSHIEMDGKPGAKNQLPELQLVIIAQASDHPLCLGLADWFRQEYKDKAVIKLILVILGIGAGVRPEFDWPHGPRFWVSQIALGNLQVEDADLFEVSQTLVILLVTSQLLDNLAKSVAPELTSLSGRWIVIGNSTVLADLTSMEEYFVSRFKKDCLEPLMGTTLNAAQASEVDRIVQNLAESYYVKMLQHAATAVKSAWKIEAHDITVDRVALEKNTSVWKAIRKTDLEQSDQLSGDFLQHLGEMENRIKTELTIEANGHLKRILRMLGYMLNRSTSKETTSDLPITLEPTWPKGIPPVDYALQRLVDIFRSPDLFTSGNRIKPNVLFGKDHNQHVAHQIMREQVRGYQSIYRTRRMLANLGGFLIYLTPAWPLLYALFLRFFNIEKILALLISTVIIVGAGLIEFFRWRSILQAKIHAHQDSIELRLRETLLGIISRLLRDHRILLREGLRLRSIAMSRVRHDVESEFSQADLELLEIELNPGSDNTNARTINELADFKQAHSFAQSAAQEIDADALANEIVHDGVLPLIFDPGRHVDVTGQFTSQLDVLVKKYFKPQDLLVNELASKQAHLQKGKIWRWLFDRAHPLGIASPHDKPVEKTFIVLGKRAILRGGFGEGTNNWPTGALVVDSMLGNEIVCLRAIVMMDKGAV
ncbi:MAG: hypothetical protein HS100_04485 [Anaerolineales bacterium]|nr:hypothetical protein [Anaerolineales bacterium]